MEKAADGWFTNSACIAREATLTRGIERALESVSKGSVSSPNSLQCPPTWTARFRPIGCDELISSIHRLVTHAWESSCCLCRWVAVPDSAVGLSHGGGADSASRIHNGKRGQKQGSRSALAALVSVPPEPLMIQVSRSDRLCSANFASFSRIPISGASHERERRDPLVR